MASSDRLRKRHNGAASRATAGCAFRGRWQAHGSPSSQATAQRSRCSTFRPCRSALPARRSRVVSESARARRWAAQLLTVCIAVENHRLRLRSRLCTLRRGSLGLSGGLLGLGLLRRADGRQRRSRHETSQQQPPHALAVCPRGLLAWSHSERQGSESARVACLRAAARGGAFILARGHLRRDQHCRDPALTIKPAALFLIG